MIVLHGSVDVIGRRGQEISGQSLPTIFTAASLTWPGHHSGKQMRFWKASRTVNTDTKMITSVVTTSSTQANP